MLTISELSKTYRGSVNALDAVDLDVSTGMFGLLGPNGAGKRCTCDVERLVSRI